MVGTLQGTTHATYKTWVYFGDGAGNFPAGRVKDFVVPWPSTPVKIVVSLTDGNRERPAFTPYPSPGVFVVRARAWMRSAISSASRA